MSRGSFERWVAEQLEQLQPGQRLPSDRKLAAMWHISERAVRSVLRGYADKGLLERVRGKGTSVPQPRPDPSLGVLGPAGAAENIAAEIRRLISRGELKVGQVLPPIKIIRLNYRVTPATVIRAYRLLTSQRIVTKVGKKYFVGGFAPRTGPLHRKHVVFFDLNGAGFEKTVSHWGMRPAYVKMERELAHHGHALRYATAEDFRTLVGTRGGLRGTDGIVVGWLDREGLAREVKHVAALEARLPRPRPPALMFSDAPTVTLPKGILLLCRGNVGTVWARVLASFLFERGHGSVALFFDNARRWPQSLSAVLKILPELRHLNGNVEFHLVIKSPDHAGDPAAFIRSGWEREAREKAPPILSKYGTISLTSIQETMTVVSDFTEAYEDLVAIRTWLFAHDSDAVRALTYCRKRGIAVPRNRSIVSFENNPSHLQHGLSTCVIDWETIGYQMAHALIGDMPVARTTKGYLRPAALVLERQTTA